MTSINILVNLKAFRMTTSSSYLGAHYEQDSLETATQGNISNRNLNNMRNHKNNSQ